eukprot:823594_1
MCKTIRACEMLRLDIDDQTMDVNKLQYLLFLPHELDVSFHIKIARALYRFVVNTQRFPVDDDGHVQLSALYVQMGHRARHRRNVDRHSDKREMDASDGDDDAPMDDHKEDGMIEEDDGDANMDGEQSEDSDIDDDMNDIEDFDYDYFFGDLRASEDDEDDDESDISLPSYMFSDHNLQSQSQ